VTKYNGATYDDPPSGVEYTPPSIEDEMPDYEIDSVDFGNVDFPSFDTVFPTSIPAVTFPPCVQTAFNNFTSTWDTVEIRGDATDRIASCYFPCTLHGGTVDGGDYLSSKLSIKYTPWGDAATLSNITVRAVKSGATVATATNTVIPTVPISGVPATITAKFTLASPLAVDGFELELASGLGAVVTYTPLGVLTSGLMSAQSLHRYSVSFPANTYLSIENYGGPWSWDFGGISNYTALALWDIDSYVDNFEGTILAGFLGFDTTNLSDLGTLGLYGEEWDTNRARVYFNSGAYTGGYVFTSDGLYSDNATTNSGTLGYTIRNARVDGRRVVLSNLVVKNVCSP